MTQSFTTTMPTPILSTRITISLVALGVCWFVSSILFGLFLRDARGVFLFLFWSPPLLAVGWVLIGIPIIAMGNRILRIPLIVLGMAGAIAGAFVMLFLALVLGLIANGNINFAGWHLDSSNSGLLIFAVVIGACAVVIYRWLLSWADTTQSNTD